MTQVNSDEERALALRTACDADSRLGLASASAALTDPSWEVRVSALNCLREFDGVQYGDRAIAALTDDEELVVTAAIECLADWRATAAVEKLKLLLDSPSELVRSYSAWALGKIGADSSVPELIARFRATDADVYASAIAEALFRLTNDRAYQDYLLRQIHADDPETRAFTSESLAGIANENNAVAIAEELRRAIDRETLPAIRETLSSNLPRIEALIRPRRDAGRRET